MKPLDQCVSKNRIARSYVIQRDACGSHERQRLEVIFLLRTLTLSSVDIEHNLSTRLDEEKPCLAPRVWSMETHSTIIHFETACISPSLLIAFVAD